MDLQVAWIGFAGAVLVALVSGSVQYWIHVDARNKRRRDAAQDTRVDVAEWVSEARRAVGGGAAAFPLRRSRLEGQITVYGSTQMRQALARFDELVGSPPVPSIDLGFVNVPWAITGLAAVEFSTQPVEQVKETFMASLRSAGGRSEEELRALGEAWWPSMEKSLHTYRAARRAWIADLSASLDRVEDLLRT